jgi:hypothetical protein
MSWKVDGGSLCAFLGQEVSLSVKFPRINERVIFKEKFKVLVSRICGRAVRNLVIVGSVGILVGVVVYWALRYSFVAVNLTSERSSAYNVVGRSEGVRLLPCGEMDMPAKRFLVGRQVDSVVSYDLEDVIE